MGSSFEVIRSEGGEVKQSEAERTKERDNAREAKHRKQGKADTSRAESSRAESGERKQNGIKRSKRKKEQSEER